MYRLPQRYQTHKDGSRLYSLKQDSDETSKTPQRQKKYNADNISSSTVRSTTQTDAIGKFEPTETFSIPPSTLRPFLLLLLSQFILFLGVGAVIPIIPIYSQSIGLSSTSNGIVISAPAVALLITSRLSAEYADRARKPAMLLGMSAIGLSDVGTAMASSLPALVAARLGLGLGRGFAEAGERGMLTDLANRAPGDWRGRGLALQQACVAVGIACGAPLGGAVVDRFGVRSGFLCVSAAAGVCLGLYALLPETVGRRSDADEHEDKDQSIDTTNDDANGVDDKADWIRLLTTSSTWRALAVCQCGSSFGYACKIAIIPILAANYLPGGITSSGFLLSAAGLAGLIGAPLGGYVTDQLGSRFAASSAGLLSGISLVLIPFGLTLLDNIKSTPLLDTVQFTVLNDLGGPGPASFVVLVLLWSIGASAQGPALIALAQQQAPVGREATALGLPRAAGDATYIIAPLILGYASDVAGSSIPGVACAVAGSAMCLGSLVLIFFPSSPIARQ
ncbi:hypothetical protein HJC23_010506 [Cyclotella cryptica]|uniref:Major facilitator superfamily (MFS) profile domain-containing protein n=1 Tax=Cyclotella cryptica TaxID=29204 RepID=A0ABD3QB37_9STRA